MMEKDLKCMACGSDVTAELQGLFDTRFGIEKVWDICRCIDCGTEQTVPLPSSEELKKNNIRHGFHGLTRCFLVLLERNQLILVYDNGISKLKITMNRR